ncbi:MAG: ATP-binding protein [Chloroflexi bacterium]|nr:ATP-binding protein [Chloroflexota bacterium]
MSEQRINPLILPGTMDKMGESLSAIRGYVSDVCGQAGLDRQATSRLKLAVDEIATNIITYSYGENGIVDGTIEVTAVIDESKLTLSLLDTGPAYDVTKRDMPDNLDAPLDQREMGGLGVFLAIRNVDEFSYQRVGENNCNNFVIYRPTAQED